MDDCLRGEGPRGGAWREEVCVLELEGNHAGSKKKILAQLLSLWKQNKIRNESRDRCCFNLNCGNMN